MVVNSETIVVGSYGFYEVECGFNVVPCSVVPVGEYVVDHSALVSGIIVKNICEFVVDDDNIVDICYVVVEGDTVHDPSFFVSCGSEEVECGFNDVPCSVVADGYVNS